MNSSRENKRKKENMKEYLVWTRAQKNNKSEALMVDRDWHNSGLSLY